MAKTLNYPDAYLARFCTDEREARAFAEVDLLGTFSTEWRDKLAQLKCYVIACVENQAQPDDLFTAKLKSYRVEFDAQLARANAAADNTDNALVFTIQLERA